MLNHFLTSYEVRDVDGLGVDTEVNLARRNVHILQVKGHLRRQIAVTIARDDLLPHVDQLDVAYTVGVFEVFNGLYEKGMKMSKF